MTRANELPYWPAAMRLDQAAAYCGLSPETFKGVCPVKPLSFTQSTRGKRYLRQRIDDWLDSIDPNRSLSPAYKFGDRLNGGKSAA